MAKDDRIVYIIGHKNPDTDSIASAIAYANLKKETGHPNYIAARCGNVSSETQYVLDRFGVKAPKFVGDVRTQVRDMDMRKIPSVSAEMSLKEAWKRPKPLYCPACILDLSEIIFRVGIIWLTVCRLRLFLVKIPRRCWLR